MIEEVAAEARPTLVIPAETTWPAFPALWPYAGLGAAHQAIHDWAAATGRRLAGPRWEIYGPHQDDPAELATEVYWLLAENAARSCSPQSLPD